MHWLVDIKLNVPVITCFKNILIQVFESTVSSKVSSLLNKHINGMHFDRGAAMTCMLKHLSASGGLNIFPHTYEEELLPATPDLPPDRLWLAGLVDVIAVHIHPQAAAARPLHDLQEHLEN